MGMLYSVLMGAAVLFLMLLFRRKKYDVSMKKVFAIQIVVTIITTLGANLGSFLGGMSFLGLRLYGILLLDTVALFALAKLYKMEVGELGDYLGPAIIAICCIVKTPCIIDGCCYGKVLFTDNLGNAVRFPSQIVEFSIWAILTVWLLWIERKGNHKNLIWSISSFWFGIFRFIVDFMRGSPNELRLKILGMPAGRFWSLIVAAVALAFMVYSFRRYYKCYPTFSQMVKTIFGITPSKSSENQ